MKVGDIYEWKLQKKTRVKITAIKTDFVVGTTIPNRYYYFYPIEFFTRHYKKTQTNRSIIESICLRNTQKK